MNKLESFTIKCPIYDRFIRFELGSYKENCRRLKKDLNLEDETIMFAIDYEKKQKGAGNLSYIIKNVNPETYLIMIDDFWKERIDHSMTTLYKSIAELVFLFMNHFGMAYQEDMINPSNFLCIFQFIEEKTNEMIFKDEEN